MVGPTEMGSPQSPPEGGTFLTKSSAHELRSTDDLHSGDSTVQADCAQRPPAQKQAASLGRNLTIPAAAPPVGDLLLRHLTVPGALLVENGTSIVNLRQLF